MADLQKDSSKTPFNGRFSRSPNNGSQTRDSRLKHLRAQMANVGTGLKLERPSDISTARNNPALPFSNYSTILIVGAIEHPHSREKLSTATMREGIMPIISEIVNDLPVAVEARELQIRLPAYQCLCLQPLLEEFEKELGTRAIPSYNIAEEELHRLPKQIEQKLAQFCEEGAAETENACGLVYAFLMIPIVEGDFSGEALDIGLNKCGLMQVAKLESNVWDVIMLSKWICKPESDSE